MLGARRWLKLGPIGFQPSEMAKLVLIIFIADIIDRKQSKNKEFKKCVLPVLIITGIFSLLIYIEPDLGNTVILAVLFMVMLFVGGAKIRHLLSIILCAMPLLYIAVLRVGYRKGRLLAFLNPEDDIMGKGYHLYQSLIAFGSGGLFGKGLGASTSKLFFLPQPHTDFILAIIGEELGFAGVSVIIILFALILYRGIRIALGAPNLFGTMMAVGISSLIAMQTIINIAVVTACIPTKGLPLPFLSFGGSSLIFNLIGIGIMLNISMHMRK
jgi:cell division protein FtsW